jgi:hypothetical protein
VEGIDIVLPRAVSAEPDTPEPRRVAQGLQSGGRSPFAKRALAMGPARGRIPARLACGGYRSQPKIL